MFKKSKNQLGQMFLITVVILGIVTAAVLPAINSAVMGGDWSVAGAIQFLNRNGYTCTTPTGTVYVDDLLPNADSTWDVGAVGNEFANAYFDDIYLGGNEIVEAANSEIFMDVLAVTANYVRNNEDLSAGIPITFTIDAQPDIPRTISGHFDAHVNITAYSITVNAVDAKGNMWQEIFTEADGWDWETDHAAATVTSIIMTARTGTGVGDTMDMGIAGTFGLCGRLSGATDVFKIKRNNADAVVGAAQVNATYDTYDMTVIGIAATDDYTIWYQTGLVRDY